MFSKPMTRRAALGKGAALVVAACSEARPTLHAAADAIKPPIPSGDHVFQFAIPAKDVKNHEITAFLWVPPNADRIRGVLVGGLTLMEQEFAVDPIIRRACAAERLAIVYLFPPIDALFDYKENQAGQLLQKALDDLGETSGYREIAVAPLFPYGHSVSTIFASHVVCWQPDRCFGALLFKGGAKTPANDPNASLAGVPILVVKGQFEEFGPGPSGVLRDFEDRETAWKGMRDQLIALRGKNENHLVSYLVEPGATHFAWSDRVAEYTGLFIRKAAQKRIPDWPLDTRKPVRCHKLDSAKGALTGSEIGKDSGAAMHGDFKGNKRKAFWHLDLELAKAVDVFHSGMFEKKPQFVTFADPKTEKPILVAHDLRLRMGVTWVGADTFKVAGTFLDKAPDKYPQVTGSVGHAEGPVRFRVFGGAIQQVKADTFRVELNGSRRLQANILAYHPGDAEYRYAEQQGRINLPKRLTQGKPQTITFLPVEPMQVGASPVRLQATSSADLPVRFYVESGPAVIDDNTLTLTEIPRRTRSPLKITIVAYQYGSAVEPFVQSAELNKQVVLVQKRQ